MFEKMLILTWAATLAGAWLAAAENGAPAKPAYQKLLIMGNSLTRHGPSTKELGWEGNWGMAATALEKDYAHQFHKLLTEKQGGVAPELITLQLLARDFPPDYKALTPRDSKNHCYTPAELKELGADLVVIQSGDNLKDATEENFAQPYGKLVRDLQAAGVKTILCCSTYWNKTPHIEMIKRVCAETGAIFVPIYELQAKPENNAKSEGHFSHPGVAAHPGDRGMAAIAAMLLAALPQ